MTKVIDPRLVKISTRTEVDIKRSLPHAALKRIGAWVFLDHFGPTVQVDGMVVAAHPHSGLQTVTWPFAGVVDHRDSVGSSQVIRAGQLNLMTAGRGVAHSEKSQPVGDQLHAVQLWIALPDLERNRDASFEHFGDLPVLELGSLTARIFIGELNGARSPARVFSPLLGAELRLSTGAPATVPLRPDWEYGLLVVRGSALVNGTLVSPDQLAYLEPGEARQLELEATGSDDLLAVLLGGEPFAEQIVMWWNFIGRTAEEIVEMRELWNARDPRFGEVIDEVGGWIPAPDLPNATLRAR